MKTYQFLDNIFEIQSFDKAKGFASFLPAIAGVKGKPLWVFYTNIGQCVGGFGIDNKDTPFTPFDSYKKARKEIPVNGFRTFIKINGKIYTPFFLHADVQRNMYVDKTSIRIEEIYPDLYKYEVIYSTISSKPYPGLIRHIRITNLSDKTTDFEIIDGANVFLPCPVSNYSYHLTNTLVGAYCLTYPNNNKPFFNFKEPESDSATVKVSNKGNGYFYIDENNNVLDVIYDNKLIFGYDDTNITPINIIDKDIKDLDLNNQVTENRLPSAYSVACISLESKKSYSFIGMFTHASSVDEFNNNISSLTYDDLCNFIDVTKDLVDSLLPKHIHTSNKIFDEYIVQSVLDNNLRGGFPSILGKDKPYYNYYQFLYFQI